MISKNIFRRMTKITYQHTYPSFPHQHNLILFGVNTHQSHTQLKKDFMRSSDNKTEFHTQLFQYIQPIYKLFFSTQATDDKKPKKHRAKSPYSANLTPSLMLPDMPKEIPDIVKPKKPEKFIPSTLSITAMFESLLSFVKPQDVVKPQILTISSTKAVPKSFSPDETIAAIAASLEEEYIGLKNQIKRVVKVPRGKAAKKIAADVTTDAKTKPVKFEELKLTPAMDALLLAKVTLCENEIKEHASRRVDLFFYLMLAVRRQFVKVEKDATVKQHGSGSEKRGTHACHSSLFPNVKLTPLPSPWPWAKLVSSVSLAGTQFEENLNTTVELPSIVNAFDGHLEGRFQQTRYTKQFLTLLNKVAANELEPIEAMHTFFNVMNAFFLHIEEKYLPDRDMDATAERRLEHTNAFKKVWEIERAGTFASVIELTMGMDERYLHSLLFLKPEEIARVKADPKALGTFYQRIQQEILQKPEEKRPPSTLKR